MTDLTKPVSRRTREPLRHPHRKVIVTLLPGDVLSLRLERQPARLALSAPVSHIYAQLACWHASAELHRRKTARQARREATPCR